MKIANKIYKENMVRIWNEAGGKCANCGRPVPKILDCIAHIESKNGSTESEILNNALVVCRELHTYEHTKAKNLTNNPCVKSYLEKYGNGKNFFRPLWNSKVGLKNV